MPPPAVVLVRQPGGGGSASGILLLFVAVVGLLALFTGNLERLIGSVAGPAGGAAGLWKRPATPLAKERAPALVPGTYGQPTPGASASGFQP